MCEMSTQTSTVELPGAKKVEEKKNENDDDKNMKLEGGQQWRCGQRREERYDGDE